MKCLNLYIWALEYKLLTQSNQKMKTPKKILSLLSLFLILVVSSCKDECDDVNCLNGGRCDDGDCICATGFEGSECQTETRAKFFGTYNAIESCSESGNFTYQINITTSAANATTVLINNFYGVGATVNATVSGSALTIPNQTVSVSGESATFSGSGQLSGNILTLSYTVTVGTSSESCTANCTKQ